VVLEFRPFGVGDRLVLLGRALCSPLVQELLVVAHYVLVEDS